MIIDSKYDTDDIIIADYNVLDFGADYTGIIDSTNAIQNVINICYEAGGGTVWMPEGIYRVTDTIYVKAFVTLRGEYQNPDITPEKYGTVVRAEVKSGLNGAPLFRIGGSAGIIGITTYYPYQNSVNPIPYNFTFEIPGNAWLGSENHMMSSIINCTIINSYRGIGISTMKSDYGCIAACGQVHESVTIENVKGTALYEGVVAYNGSDVGTWKNIVFNNSYWANAGSKFNAPAKSILDNWTINNGIAFRFGDLEWEQFIGLMCSYYKTGIEFVKGQRIKFAGEFMWSSIKNCNTAVKANELDERWGVSFLRCVLEGSHIAVDNKSSGYISATDCTIKGSTTGEIHIYDTGNCPEFAPEKTSIPKINKMRLYDVTKAPYNAPVASSSGKTLPDDDATKTIQFALNDASNNGGGIVYLPAGWYRLDGNLTVPSNVELRGCSSVPNRDQSGRSAGTVLFAYSGKKSTSPDTDTALITLDGDVSGVRGLRIFYPENNPKGKCLKYPYSIRGNGENVYVVNVGLTNAYNGIDVKTHICNNHYVKKVAGIVFNKTVSVGHKNGWIEGIHTNGNAVTRVGFGIPGWINEATVFPDVIDAITRENQVLIIVDGATDETIVNSFAYGSKHGVVVKGQGKANIFNIGTDNLNDNGYTVKIEEGHANIYNLMRYNGEKSTFGSVQVYNNLILDNSKKLT